MEFQDYIDAFSHLHVNKKQGKLAPHKAVMLLSVIDLVEDGTLQSNVILINDRLKEQFRKNWDRFVGDSSVFNCQFSNTFAHLSSDPLWTLHPLNVNSIPKEFSIGKLRECYSSAEISEELFEALKDKNHCAHLRAVLIGKYICQLFE